MPQETFEGKYIRIDYNDTLAGTVTVTRKSSGRTFPMEGGDVADWVRQMVADRALRDLLGGLRRGHNGS